MRKKTKIVSTLGPASNTQEIMEELIELGVNVARFNFSHGSHEEHKERFDQLVAAREATGKMVATLLDLKGPEIRTGRMTEERIPVVPGQVIRVGMDETVEGDANFISVSYDELVDDVTVGDRLLVDDGLVELLVTDVDEEANEIITKALNHGVLESRKGVNVPNVSINLPSVTDADVADIRFGVKTGFDFIAQSFVRRASDVMAVRDILEQEGNSKIKIVSKIENQEGVDNIDDILEVSDAIMVARGDLGVEIPTEEVPIVQKYLIKKCNELGKPVITATQMLDSMEINPRPTRAEAGDVANAIFDGTDAVMLSGETAAGNYPAEAVQTMSDICYRTEQALIGQDAFKLKRFDQADMTEAIGQAVGHTVKNLGIKTIVAATSSGHTALMISKYRPNANIIAATFDHSTSRSLALAWGVEPYVIKRPSSTDEMMESATELSMKVGLAKEGDLIAITAGVPVGETGTTNLMKIQLIGTNLVRGEGVGRGNFIGKAVVVETGREAIEKVTEGSVLVTRSTNVEFAPIFQKLGAVITEEGGVTSHAALMGLEFGIPVIVAAEDAMKLIEDGELITVDARRGTVYRGATVIL